jgi:hypothetical protein
MNTQRFTRYWNIARFMVIAISAVIFTFLTIRAHCSGFAPNIEVDHFHRNDPEDQKSDFQKQQEAREDSTHDDNIHTSTDNDGGEHYFQGGGEWG